MFFKPLAFLKTLFCFTIMIFAQPVLSQESYDHERIINHRDSINHHFADPETSILDSTLIPTFDHLPFFEIDSTFRVNASFKKAKKRRTIIMKTSTDRMAEYLIYGTISFELKGEKCKLTVYRNKAHTTHPLYKDYLFLPFTDMSTGEESYGTGRYLDLKISDLDHLILDFNYCYAPYCAYSDRYSCPVPPSNNHINLKVLAGASGIFEH
jgi:uncharacterized protein (DUF1684 family)